MKSLRLFSRSFTGEECAQSKEESEPLTSEFERPYHHPASNWNPGFQFKFWPSCSLILGVALGISLLYNAKHYASVSTVAYSPVRAGGAERFINTQYEPSKLFQSPPSDEVDNAWEGWLRENDRMIKISLEDAKTLGLPETVEMFKDLGYGAYGLGVYHQMHCLNRLRKAFYIDHYYPNESHEMVLHHVGHCLDVVRQSLLCHGDTSLVYWWRQNFTYVDDSGTRRYAEDYLRMNTEERAKSAFVRWDVDVQCRDMDAINAWVQKNQIDNDKYGEIIVD